MKNPDSIIKTIENSQEFSKWKKENPNFFLAHVFVLLGEPITYQVGYFSAEEKVMASFQLEDEKIILLPPSPILAKGKEILKLENPKIKISADDALSESKELLKENYPAQTPIKTFFIFQQLVSGPGYNITFFSQSFHTINIKIDANSGKVIKHSIQKIMDFVQ